jgi:hypothetical protein
LIGNTVGKTPLGTSWYRWEDNIKLDLKEMGCENISWIDLSSGLVSVVSFCEHGNEPSKCIKD